MYQKRQIPQTVFFPPTAHNFKLLRREIYSDSVTVTELVTDTQRLAVRLTVEFVLWPRIQSISQREKTSDFSVPTVVVLSVLFHTNTVQLLSNSHKIDIFYTLS